MLNSLATGNKEATVSSETLAETPLSKLVTTHAEAVGGETSKELPNSIGGTDPQSVEDILSRRAYLTTGNFSSSDVQWNAVLSNYDPWTTWLNLPFVKSHLKGFNRLRADLEVEVVVTAPPSVYGLYIVGAVSECPTGQGTSNGTDIDGPDRDNPFTLSQDVHAMIDLSTSTTVRLKLPWVSPYDALDLNIASMTLAEQLPIWRVMIYPLSKLRSAATTDAVTATYTVYARLLPKYSLTVAIYQGKQIKSARGAHYADGQKSGGGEISGTLSKVGQAAAAIGAAVPFLAPFAGPVAIGSSVASKIASMFGFTRESTVETPDRVINRLFSPLTVVDGVDGSESVGLLSDPSTSIDPRIGGGIEGDPCTYEDLFSRWTLVRSATWSNSDPINKILLGFQVSPGICNELLGVKYSLTCAYVGAPFRYWRGSMEYMIVVPTSPFHRGTLQVSWDPVVALDTDNLDITNTETNVIYDISVTSQLCVRVGYVSEQPCKELSLFSDVTGQSVAMSKYLYNGQLSIRVQGALRSQTAPTTVDILVFARAASDMRFGVPALSQLTVTNAVRTIGPYRLQAGGIADDVEPDVEMVQLVGPVKDEYPTGAILWGEDIASVRALLQKPSSWIKFNIDPDLVDSPYFFCGIPALPLYPPPPYIKSAPHGPICPNYWSQALVNEQFTWLGWYGAMFTGLRGSVRVKALARPVPSTSTDPNIENGFRNFIQAQACTAKDLMAYDGTTLNVGLQLVPDLTQTMVPHGGIQSASSSNGAQEFLIPYYGTRKFESNRAIRDYTLFDTDLPAVDGYGRAPMFAVGQISAGSDLSGTLNIINFPPLLVIVGGGPDIAPVRFRRCPAINPPRQKPLTVTGTV
jgi:hypothetical protein